jgi:hypothetical protein
MKVAEGDLLTAAVVDFTSREHRDEVMAKVMATRGSRTSWTPSSSPT